MFNSCYGFQLHNIVHLLYLIIKKEFMIFKYNTTFITIWFWVTVLWVWVKPKPCKTPARAANRELHATTKNECNMRNMVISLGFRKGGSEYIFLQALVQLTALFSIHHNCVNLRGY